MLRWFELVWEVLYLKAISHGQASLCNGKTNMALNTISILLLMFPWAAEGILVWSLPLCLAWWTAWFHISSSVGERFQLKNCWLLAYSIPLTLEKCYGFVLTRTGWKEEFFRPDVSSQWCLCLRALAEIVPSLFANCPTGGHPDCPYSWNTHPGVTSVHTAVTGEAAASPIPASSSSLEISCISQVWVYK